MPADIFAPRANTTQQLNTIRRTLNFGTTGVRLIGSIPVGSFISKVEVAVSAAFNAGTTNPILLGVTQAGSELLIAADTTAGTIGYYTNARGNGMAQTTTPGIASTVGDPEGGVGIWLNYTPTGTAPTAGSATVLISFMPPVES